MKWLHTKLDNLFQWMAYKSMCGWYFYDWRLTKPKPGAGQTLGWKLYYWRKGLKR